MEKLSIDEQIKKLTREQKESGIWIDKKTSEIITGYNNMPDDFTGEYKEWYKNGQLCVHSFYEHGELHGENKEWYKNGQLWAHSFYEYGKLHGEDKEWEDDGQLYTHFFYANGKRVKDLLNEIYD